MARSLVDHVKPESESDFRIWGTIRCPEPPSCRYHHDDLLFEARAMLEKRMNHFPEMILRGELTNEAARREVLVVRKMIADLEWIIAAKEGDFEQPIPINEAHRKAICALLDESIDALSQLFSEAGNPVPERLSDQAHHVIALRWNYDPERGPIGTMGEQHRSAILTGKLRHQARLQQQRSIAS